MRWIVVYDITNDVLRGKVSERLKDYGLERIQYSAFQGELLRHALASLKTDLRRMLNEGEETDSVIIFPLCDSCFKTRITIGADKEMEGDAERVSLF
ncbi:MAG: CRISPR-associated endonuclease Cas2 [Candidatus Thorarchaeota archaeon]|nr:CRISPR-associated endonuclease Cas2 [Candidatus Thorarchaeota archaeon]